MGLRPKIQNSFSITPQAQKTVLVANGLNEIIQETTHSTKGKVYVFAQENANTNMTNVSDVKINSNITEKKKNTKDKKCCLFTKILHEHLLKHKHMFQEYATRINLKIKLQK